MTLYTLAYEHGYQKLNGVYTVVITYDISSSFLVIYDKRYWLYNVRSWSETTFLMTVPVNKISATE